MDMPESVSEISQVPVIREFIDVFLGELFGMPSEREIEFLIELELGTSFMSCTPIKWCR